MEESGLKQRDSIYREFHEDIVPVVQYITEYFPEESAPLEAYNESRAILAHFLRIHKSSDADFIDTEYRRAYRHIERCYLDVRKYACLLIKDEVEEFLNPRNKWRIHKLDKGRFLDRITTLQSKASNTLLEAKRSDSLTDRDDTKRLYNNAFE